MNILNKLKLISLTYNNNISFIPVSAICSCEYCIDMLENSLYYRDL